MMKWLCPTIHSILHRRLKARPSGIPASLQKLFGSLISDRTQVMANLTNIIYEIPLRIQISENC